MVRTSETRVWRISEASPTPSIEVPAGLNDCWIPAPPRSGEFVAAACGPTVAVGWFLELLHVQTMPVYQLVPSLEQQNRQVVVEYVTGVHDIASPCGVHTVLLE